MQLKEKEFGKNVSFCWWWLLLWGPLVGVAIWLWNRGQQDLYRWQLEQDKKLKLQQQANKSLEEEVKYIRQEMRRMVEKERIQSEKLLWLENQTPAGRNNTMRIVLLLQQLRRSIREGLSLTIDLQSVEQLEGVNDGLAALVKRLQGYDGQDFSDDRIHQLLQRILLQQQQQEVLLVRNKKLQKFLASQLHLWRVNRDDKGFSTDLGRAVTVRNYLEVEILLRQRCKQEEKLCGEILKLLQGRREALALLEDMYQLLYTQN
jgi:hypothetical protein